jgi:hypothetical protein
MPAIDFTDEQLRQIARLIGDRDYGVNAEIMTKIKAVLPEPKVRCFHCRAVMESEKAHIEHLIKVEHYEDDEYGEDTAQTNAWTAWHTRRV